MEGEAAFHREKLPNVSMETAGWGQANWNHDLELTVEAVEHAFRLRYGPEGPYLRDIDSLDLKECLECLAGETSGSALDQPTWLYDFWSMVPDYQLLLFSNRTKATVGHVIGVVPVGNAGQVTVLDWDKVTGNEVQDYPLNKGANYIEEMVGSDSVIFAVWLPLAHTRVQTARDAVPSDVYRALLDAVHEIHRTQMEARGTGQVADGYMFPWDTCFLPVFFH